MKRILSIVLILTLLISMIPLLVSGVAEADAVVGHSTGELQYPIEGYVVNGYYFGQYLPTAAYPSRYHLGEDICKPAETKVFAMADGVVKVANGNHASYGGLIIIEHTLADGKTYCSLYGHLKHSETLVEPGNTVYKGQPIGELSGNPADYGGPGSVPHLHFGIRFGASPGEHALDEDTTSGWYWGGYGKKDPRTVSDWWIKPSDFIAGGSTPSLVALSPGSDEAPGPWVNTLTPILEWTDVAGAAYYRFAVSRSPYGSAYIVYHGQTSETQAPIPGGKLLPFSNAVPGYRWNVRAYGPANEVLLDSNTLYFRTFEAEEPPECGRVELVAWEQLASDALLAGFTREDAATIVAIAAAESGRNRFACNYNPPVEVSLGVLQLNALAHPDVAYDYTVAYDTDRAFAKAHELFLRKGDFSDWSVYTNGRYLEFLDDAKRAVERVRVSEGLDVFMLVDLSGSFSSYLPAFKAQAPDLMANLRSSYPDVRFGLGKFEDYPISPFGSASSGDKAYERLIDLTADAEAVLSIINGLYTRYGGDTPESQLAALYQAATGEGQVIGGYPQAEIPSGQQANFRDGVIKLFILWTDAPFHRPGDPGSIPYPGPSFDETVAAILALDPPMVIGISSGTGGLADLRAIAAATNAIAPPGGVDTTGDGIIDIPEGEPLVASIGYSAHGIAAAIESLISAAVMLPIASAGGPYTGEVGETIVFDGSESFDPDGWIVLYEWDFESDGVFDFSSIEPTAEHVYTAESSGIATLRVTDNDGNTAIGTAPVEILPRSVIPAESVTVDPETLNLRAPAKWITAYIELPEEHDVDDIDISTVRLLYDSSELYADWGDLQDGVFMAKFDWATVAGWFEGLHDVEVELTVAGEVDGVDFEGRDTISVIDPPQRRGGR